MQSAQSRPASLQIALNSIRNEVPASCENEGSYEQLNECRKCGDQFWKPERIDPLNHDYLRNKYIEKPATCSETGIQKDTLTCARCGNSYVETYTIPLGEHDYVEGVCKVCGASDPNCSNGEVCDHNNTIAKTFITDHSTTNCLTSYWKIVTTLCLDCGEFLNPEPIQTNVGHYDDNGDGFCDRCNEGVERCTLNGDECRPNGDGTICWNCLFRLSDRDDESYNDGCAEGCSHDRTITNSLFTPYRVECLRSYHEIVATVCLDCGGTVEQYTIKRCVCHYDDDGDGICDRCQEAHTSCDSNGQEHTTYDGNDYCMTCHFAVQVCADDEHVDEDDSGRCDICGRYIV